MYHLLQEASGKSSIGDLLVQAATGVVTANTQAGKPKYTDKYSYSSIAKAASKLIAVFPVLASRTVSGETVRMVSKYIEQRSCNMLQIGLQAANIDNAENGIEYLRHYHQNLDMGGDTVNAVIDLMDDWVTAYKKGSDLAKKGFHESFASEKYYDMINEEAGEYQELFENDVDLEISGVMLRELMDLMKANENLEFYDTKLNPMSINDFVVDEMAGDYHVSIGRYDILREAKNSSKTGLRDEFKFGDDSWKYYDRSNPIHPGEPGYDDCDAYDSLGNGYMFKPGGREKALRDQADADANKAKADQDKQAQYRDQDRVQAEKDRKKAEAERNREKKLKSKEYQRQRDIELRDEENERQSKISSGRNVTLLKDQDIKKMNDAVPSILVVKFYKTENASVMTEFIIGVKSKVVPVTTTEILRRIMNDNQDGKKFLTLMRVITGELKASDVIFGLSRINDDLMSTRKKGAYGDTWELLRNRAALAKKQIARGQRNDFSAITTILISQNDADELYREENFDITEYRNARHFMDSYNIMAFIIADDATESLKVLFDDGSKSFEEISYRMLERESTEDYKKAISLMAKNA